MHCYCLQRFTRIAFLFTLLFLTIGCRRNDAGISLPTRASIAEVPPTHTATSEPVLLPTLFQTLTPTNTPTPSETPEGGLTETPSVTPSPSRTPFPIPTITRYQTRTPIPTATQLVPISGGGTGGTSGGSGGGTGGTSGGGGGGTFPTATWQPNPTWQPSPTQSPRATWQPSPTWFPSPTRQWVPTNTPAPPANGWWGQYYNNRDLSGSPAFSRLDPAISFDWGTGAPAQGLDVNQFSVRWERTINTTAGTYLFGALADDGVRVYVDGQLLIDEWHNAGNQVYTAERVLTSGNHRIRVEYYESGGDALIAFGWERSSDFPQWRAEYYNNTSLSGTPVVIRNDANISFDWGVGAPVSGLGVDNFSVRWGRIVNFTAGNYIFNATADDGIRVWIDNQLIIDEWHGATATTYSVSRSLSAGNHTIVVEYLEQTGDANVQFWWQAGGTTTSGWTGEYYSNRTLSGVPALTRNDSQINFRWGSGTPGTGIPVDDFSVRWTRSDTFNAGTYIFTARFDDGVRVYIDNSLIIDDWVSGAEREVSVSRNMSAGSHLIRVEYFEGSGDATAVFSYARDAGGGTPAPTPVPQVWRGQYFDNPDLAGNPVFEQNYNEINFDWGLNAPIAGLPGDHFSAKFWTNIDFAPGTYTLSVLVDDGVRLYVDGNLVINQWHLNTPQRPYWTTLSLSGNTSILIEYYDDTFGALLKFSYREAP